MIRSLSAGFLLLSLSSSSAIDGNFGLAEVEDDFGIFRENITKMSRFQVVLIDGSEINLYEDKS